MLDRATGRISSNHYGLGANSRFRGAGRGPRLPKAVRIAVVKVADRRQEIVVNEKIGSFVGANMGAASLSAKTCWGEIALVSAQIMN